MADGTGDELRDLTLCIEVLREQMEAQRARFETALDELRYAAGRSWIERLMFEPTGRPRKLFRKLFFHTSGKPRGALRRRVLHRDGRPRLVFARWLASAEYRDLPWGRRVALAGDPAHHPLRGALRARLERRIAEARAAG